VALCPQRHLTFDLGDLKLRDLAKLLWFFKLIMTKSNFKKLAMTSFQGHRYYVTEKHHQYSVTRFLHFGTLKSKFLAMPVHLSSLLLHKDSSILYKSNAVLSSQGNCSRVLKVHDEVE